MLKSLITPISIIFGSIIIGIILQKIIFVSFSKLAKKTKWKGDDIIIHSVKGVLIFWSFLIGIYIALPFFEMPEKILPILNKVFLTVMIFSVTLVLSKIASWFTKTYEGKEDGTLAKTTIFNNIVRVLIFALGFLIILQSLGIAITPILTALGVGGLAVALALQDTLSNLFSGFQIIAAGQIKKGNYIKLASGEAGYVTDISWRNTTIKAFGNNSIVIPNSKLASAIITNFNLPNKEMSVSIAVGVSYDSNLEEVERITLEVAKKVMNEIEGAATQIEPFMRYKSFGDFSINFSIILYVKEYVNKFILRHEFIKELDVRYKKEGIEIPFPIRTVQMKSE